MKNQALFTSNTNEWATPQAFFDELNREFSFTLDPCATPENAKCSRYFTKEIDGLSQSWCGETVFCNPPYGRDIAKWVKKAHEEVERGQRLLCLYRLERIRRIFMTTYTADMRFDSCVVVFILMKVRQARHFRQWS